MNNLYFFKSILLRTILCITILSFPKIIFGQFNNIDKNVSEKFESADLSNIQTTQELVKSISLLTNNKQEQLQMLLMWSYQNMNVDSNRFFNGGTPLTSQESIIKRIGLCDEFSSIVNDFCKAINISTIKVFGYVRYSNFAAGDVFKEANHVWNAVYIDSTWKFCDLFWSISELKMSNSSSPRFNKRLNTKYFLAQPNSFLNDHLPCDPVFQFDNYPINIKAFTSREDGIDSTMEKMPYINFKDSLKNLMRLNTEDRDLRMAQHSFLYNKNNLYDLIFEYYNYSTRILNNNKSTKSELQKAKGYLSTSISLIDSSSDNDIKALKEKCKSGLLKIDKKLSVQK